MLTSYCACVLLLLLTTTSHCWQEGPPAVRYRVWFTNDEDLLGGWAADPLAGAVFHIEMWDKVFEVREDLNGLA